MLHIIFGFLPVSARLTCTRVSRQLRTTMTPLIPGQYSIQADRGGLVTRILPLRCMSQEASGSPLDDQSELLLIFNIDPATLPPILAQVSAALVSVQAGVRRPIDQLTLMSPMGYMPMLAQLLPQPLRKSLHTLHLHRLEHYRGGVDRGLSDIISAFPRIQTLHLSSCTMMAGWGCLHSLQTLRSLSVSEDPAGGAVAGIKGLTQLTSLELSGMGSLPSMHPTLMTLTNLVCIRVQDPSQSDTPLTHGVPACLSSLRSLQLDVDGKNGAINVPATISSLRIRVRTACPRLALPSGLTHLHASFNTLRWALVCRSLTHLCWTHSDDELHVVQHVLLLMALAKTGAWRHLRTIAITPEWHGCFEWENTKHNLHVNLDNSEFDAQLLNLLAGPECTIRDVTLFQRFRKNHTAVRALLGMPSLCSVTLVERDMTDALLMDLVGMPNMQTIRLVGVSGISPGLLLDRTGFGSVCVQSTNLSRTYASDFGLHVLNA